MKKHLRGGRKENGKDDEHHDDDDGARKKSRQAEIQLFPFQPCTSSFTPPTPLPPVVVCLMSEKIYKIEIENKLTTLFVAHAEREREGAGTAEPREECLDIIKDGPHDCTGRRGVGGG